MGQGSTGRARSWVVACGVNIARGVVGVTAFASTPRSPSSLVVRDGCTLAPSFPFAPAHALAPHRLTQPFVVAVVCTPDGKYAYLDQTKPVVVVPAPAHH